MPAAIASRGDWKRDLLAVEQHPPAVGPVEAGDDLDQRRLAGAVLAHQRMDLAGPEVERDLVERLDAGKRLADRLHLELHGQAVPVLTARQRLSHTAARMSAPSRNCTQYGSTLASTMPFSISAMRMTANIVPSTEM